MQINLTTILILATVLICCVQGAINRAKEADDDRRERMCFKYEYKENSQRLIKKCALCCYEEDRNIDEVLSRQLKSCICSNSAEFDTNENEGEAYDIEDEIEVETTTQSITI